MYNINRNDRAPNTKDKSHDGVLLAITKDFISSEKKPNVERTYERTKGPCQLAAGA